MDSKLKSLDPTAAPADADWFQTNAFIALQLNDSLSVPGAVSNLNEE